MLLNFDEMLAVCETKPELRAKEEVVAGVPVTIFTYMVSMQDTFDSELAKEFRGTTFRNDTKELICRPLPKFFNIGERPDSQADNVNWDNALFFTKHDGSMLTPVMIDGETHWKTKKSFSSDVAVKAAAYAKRNKEKVPFLAEWEAGLFTDMTPVYEYVGPGNQIVLPYEKEEMIFLGMRDMETGRWHPNEHTMVDDMTLEEVMGLEKVEGFIIYDGELMVKAKTTWYMERHKICSDFNVKSIINATLNETVDDMLGTIAQLGLTLRYHQVQELRNKVATEQLFVEEDVKLYFMLLEKQELETRKDQALWINGHGVPQEYRGIMFKMLDGKDTKEMQDRIVFDRIYSEYKEVEVADD